MEKDSEFILVVTILVSSFFSSAFGQLPYSQAISLFRLRQQLEYPAVLSSWNRQTSFCSLPPSPALTIVCAQDRITELTIVGNKIPSSASRKSFVFSSGTLSSNFSIDSLFTTISKLSSLEVLSLVSLGLWGPIPAKINRFSALRVLNVSSNSIYGQIPAKISSVSNLQSLVLHDNLLNGTVPDLSGLGALEELDMGNNLLGPKFPSLPNKLVTIKLNSNEFSSIIPSIFASFNQIQMLDLSSNELMGPIPIPLFSLPSIQYLSLAGNKLRGSLPKTVTCNKELSFVDISDNLLIGNLPSCIVSNSSNKVVFYSGNCLASASPVNQHPYSYCNKENAFAAIPTKKRSSKSNVGLVIGIGAAIAGGLITMGAVIWLIFRKFGGKNAADHLVHSSIKEKASLRVPPRRIADTRHATKGMRLGALALQPYHAFTMEELEEATNNFDQSNFIGEGSKGKLYKGWLRDGSLVVVRCLQLKQNYSPQSLPQYTETISKLRHRNLVSLLGHYIDTKTIFLVLEYVPSGTLRSHLTDQKYEMLRWPQRVATAIGVAKGIQYLHTEISPGMYGNDLKIDNILLDEHLTAKISGYNVPLPSKYKAAKVGSESPLGGGPSDLVSIEQGEKADIYQLGVILLELITGNPITSENELKALKHKLEKSLNDVPKKLRAATDPAMRGTYAYESVRTAVEIAVNCLSEDSSKRPSVEDVLWNLQYSVQVQDGWASSGNLSSTLSNLSEAFTN